MRTRSRRRCRSTSASVPTASTRPVNIPFDPRSGPSGSTAHRDQLRRSGRRSASNNCTPSAPSDVGATIRCTRSTTPASQAAACSAAPPSSSSVEMSHASERAQILPPASPDLRRRVAPAASSAWRAFGRGGRRGRRRHDYDRPGVEGREHPRGRRGAQPPVEDHARQRPRAIARRAPSAAGRRRASSRSRRRSASTAARKRWVLPVRLGRRSAACGRRARRRCARRGCRRLQRSPTAALRSARMTNARFRRARVVLAARRPRPRCRARAARRSLGR